MDGRQLESIVDRWAVARQRNLRRMKISPLRREYRLNVFGGREGGEGRERIQ